MGKHKFWIFAPIMVFLVQFVYAQTPDKRIVYLTSSDGEPYGSSGNFDLMDFTFGSGEWEEQNYETVTPTDIFNEDVCLIFMEGTYTNYDEFTDFYSTNISSIEDYVSNGGHLFVNCFSNGDFYLGFDSITKVDNVFSSVIARVTDPTNLVFLGPHYPVLNSFKAVIDESAVGFGTFEGTSYDVYLYDSTYQSLGANISDYREIIIGKIFGEGEAIFSNGPFDFWDVYYESYKNVRSNLLWHLAPCLHSEKDLGIQTVIYPAEQCNLSESETLWVLAHNFGFSNQDEYEISFQIDGGDITTESFTNSVTAYLSDTVSFFATADFSECGNHIVKAWTTLIGDTIPSNDTLTYVVNNICASETTIGLPDEICFNNDPLVAHPEVEGGIWEGVGITDTNLGIFDPSIVGEGNNSIISYTYQTAIDYIKETISFTPPSVDDSTIISLLYNDDVDTLSLPFDFVFFSNSYDTIYPSSNGYIAFGEPHDTWYINIPDVGGINNLLALAGYDLDPSAGGSIYYSVVGAAPYREFQLRYNDVPLSIDPDYFIDVTTVLYESTNIIDIYVDRLPEVGAFGFVQGISNEDGSQYYYTKTTGTPVWFIGANDTAFRFTPTLCPRTIFETIEVIGNINQDVLGADTMFCYGESLLLESDYASSNYLWNTGDTTQMITVDEEGFYNIELNYIPGCMILDTIYVTEIDSIILNITSTPTDPDVNTGTATVEVISGGLPPYSYLWSTLDTSTTIEGLGNDMYTVTVTDAFGCATSMYIIVQENVSVYDLMDSHNVHIYPNPTNGFFLIEIENELLNTTLEIVNIENQLIYSSIIKTSISNINLSNFGKGIYYVIVKSETGNYYSSLIIQ